MTSPSMILHVGAPKCGSSALQTALTRQPDVRSPTGLWLRYVSLRRVQDGYRPIYGSLVRRQGRSSAYGYASWPNFGRHTDGAPLLAALRQVLEEGQVGGWVPVVSCEGWINHPQVFAAALADWGYPVVDLLGFLRPPVEWVNAAWWQWGIWSFPTVDVWLDRQTLPYRFADDLEQWSQIPNVRLQVRRSRPDAVQTFSDLYAIDLGPRPSVNMSSPACLIGFLRRNRQFRPTPHDAQAEFIFQRWCPPVSGNRLWALSAEHVRRLRPTSRRCQDVLARILPQEARADLAADPNWYGEQGYHDAIRSGVSFLRAPEDLPRLYAALAAGIAAASGRPARDLPAPLKEADPVEQWDPVLADLFDRLTKADIDARQGGLVDSVIGIGHNLMRGGHSAKNSQ